MSLTLEELKQRGLANPVRVIHTLCGHIVFFTDGVPQKPGVLNPRKIVLFNGATPKDGDPIICTGCGYDVRKNQLEWVVKND